MGILEKIKEIEFEVGQPSCLHCCSTETAAMTFRAACKRTTLVQLALGILSALNLDSPSHETPRPLRAVDVQDNAEHKGKAEHVPRLCLSPV